MCAPYNSSTRRNEIKEVFGNEILKKWYDGFTDLYEIKSEVISPYISVEEDEARISVRIKDSLNDLRRNELIKKINTALKKPRVLKKTLKNIIFFKIS